MSILRLHFDADVNIGKTIKKLVRVKVELAYLGQNIYNIKAIDLSAPDPRNLKPEHIIHNQKHEFPRIAGNGRKSFVKIRDFALNAIEGKPLKEGRIA